jgi:GrpB-like predicted nucleotidyltransferase (UPF0157 family)
MRENGNDATDNHVRGVARHRGALRTQATHRSWLNDMKIGPFDESLAHREIVPYEPVYRDIFRDLRQYIETRLGTVELCHIGSTAIPDLRGKPMLDIAALTTREDLRAVQKEIERLGFHRRDVWVDRDDKPYVCGSVDVNGKTYNINVHICRPNDPVHKDSLRFIAILNKDPSLRRRYEAVKDRAHSIDPVNPDVYNREKEAVIKEIHKTDR